MPTTLLVAGKPADSVNYEEAGYDAYIVIPSFEWQKGNRAMHNILSKMKIKTGDVFLLARMKKLSEAGKIEINGDPSKGWKDFEIKLKSASGEEVTVNQEAS